MATVFSTLQTEVKRRSTRNQSGNTFDDAVKFAINQSLLRISRDAPWRSMRRKSIFNTISSYTKGSPSASITSGSNVVTLNGATLITDGVNVGRKIKVSQSQNYYFINQINSETQVTLDNAIYSSTSTGGTWEILPQEEYSLPIQVGHRMFMWHEGFGYPFRLNYITDPDFYQHGVYLTIKYIPTHYRMWGEDMVIAQVRQPSVVSVSSSSSLDTNKSITVFGNVSDLPDYEVITTNNSDGTISVSGSKIFQYVERIVKGSATVGRITCTANSGQDTLSILPVGDTTSGPLYRKVQLYPLPNQVFPVHVEYYKEPFILVNDGDVHELGEDFNESIILLATAKMKAEENQAESDRFTLLWQDEMKSLKRTNVDKWDWQAQLRRPRQASSDALVSPNLLYRQAGANFGPATRL